MDQTDIEQLQDPEALKALLQELCQRKPELVEHILRFATDNLAYLKQRAEERADFFDKLALSYIPFVSFADPNSTEAQSAGKYLRAKLEEGINQGYLCQRTMSSSEKKVLQFVNRVEKETVFTVEEKPCTESTIN